MALHRITYNRDILAWVPCLIHRYRQLDINIRWVQYLLINICHNILECHRMALHLILECIRQVIQFLQVVHSLIKAVLLLISLIQDLLFINPLRQVHPGIWASHLVSQIILAMQICQITLDLLRLRREYPRNLILDRLSVDHRLHKDKGIRCLLVLHHMEWDLVITCNKVKATKDILCLYLIRLSKISPLLHHQVHKVPHLQQDQVNITPKVKKI